MIGSQFTTYNGAHSHTEAVIPGAYPFLLKRFSKNTDANFVLNLKCLTPSFAIYRHPTSVDDDDPPPPYSLPTQNGSSQSSRPSLSQIRSTSAVNLTSVDPTMPPSMPRLYPVTNGGVPGSSRFSGNLNSKLVSLLN